MQATQTAIPTATGSFSRTSSFLAAIARNRGVHFAVLGSAIFLLAPKPDDPSKLLVTTRELAALHATQAAKMHVAALTPELTASVDQRAIEDEIVYREALRLGLDKGDNVVRQHLITKTLIFAEDLGGASRKPTDAELHAFFARTQERWRREPRVHFIHVFTSKREDALALVSRVGEAERAAPDQPPALGDAFPRARDMGADRRAIVALFGDAFAESILQQPVGAWGEPVESRYGWHLVKVLSVAPGGPMTFAEAKPQLLAAWTLERRHQAVDAFLARAYPRYHWLVDGVPRALPTHTDRLGQRPDPSAED